MDFTVQNEKKNSLTGCTEYTVRVAYEGSTPGRYDLQQSVAKQLKSKPELTVVRKVKQEFGKPVSILDVAVYDSEEMLKEYESGYVVQRHDKAGSKVAEAKKKAEEEAKAAAEAKKAEAAKEEASSEDASSEEKGDAE